MEGIENSRIDAVRTIVRSALVTNSSSFSDRTTPVMPKDALTITDQRTNQTYEAPIEHETIRAMDLRKIKTKPEEFGIMTYDPAFMNTAFCKSSITFIDGDKGILRSLQDQF